MGDFALTEVDRTIVRDLLLKIRDAVVRDDFVAEFANDKNLETTLALGTALLHDFACEAIHLSRHMVEDADSMNEATFKELDDIQADIYTATTVYSYVFARLKSAAAN